jgi:general secretion pathway protein E/type IV pilus assembly protein PilB
MSESTQISTEVIQSITTDQAWHYKVVPKTISDKENVFYAASDNSRVIVDELKLLFGKEISFELIGEDEIQNLLSRYYRKGKQSKSNGVLFSKHNDFLMDLIQEAYRIECSDIHIETYEDRCRVRMRIDGKLIERFTISKEIYPSLVNKIKIKANLDIAEKRLPQDGRIFYTDEFCNFDIRVSVLPGLHGEKVVLRLLSKDSTHIEIDSLGFTNDQLKAYKNSIVKPHGIILISGPTGSGKTTTLYATLKILNSVESNILTIEDPIEYTLEGINQVQLKEDIGLTFANALRTFLRQDPDIIMLGEIRDVETAQMAIRASLTGHLVLSTIHTNSAIGTISRLQDMGIPPYLLASTLNLSVAQRLIRKLCPHCKQEKPLLPTDINLRTNMDTLPSTQFIPVGCNSCYYTGYKGRRAIYEMIEINDSIRQYIRKQEVDNLQFEYKFKTLVQAAIEMFAEGETSLEEIFPLLVDMQ